MDCPSCNQKTNISEISNQYFLGRNSSGIPFFKCESCGIYFYVDKDKVAHIVPRTEKGYRFVPIVSGIFFWIIAVVIFLIFGGNIITWVIGGLLMWVGWSNIKIGLFANQKLIDEMCLDQKVPLSKQAEKEYKKINKLE